MERIEIETENGMLTIREEYNEYFDGNAFGVNWESGEERHEWKPPQPLEKKFTRKHYRAWNEKQGAGNHGKESLIVIPVGNFEDQPLIYNMYEKEYLKETR